MGIWYFFMKRMSGQQPGFMSLGKNKAKIYMQDELDVTFRDAAGVDEAKQELMELIELLLVLQRLCFFSTSPPQFGATSCFVTCFGDAISLRSPIAPRDDFVDVPLT